MTGGRDEAPSYKEQYAPKHKHGHSRRSERFSHGIGSITALTRIGKDGQAFIEMTCKDLCHALSSKYAKYALLLFGICVIVVFV